MRSVSSPTSPIVSKQKKKSPAPSAVLFKPRRDSTGNKCATRRADRPDFTDYHQYGADQSRQCPRDLQERYS